MPKISSLSKKDVFDYFIGIVLIFLFSWNPDFAHGYIVGPDEGQHLAWINEILHGKVLYRDIYMFYGPLLEFMPAVFMKIAGISLDSHRLFYLLSKISTLIIAYLILKLVLKKRALLYLGLLTLIATQVSDFWAIRWGGPRLLFGLASIYFLIIYLYRKYSIFLLLAGASSALAFFTSQEIGIFTMTGGVIFLLAIVVHENEKIDIRKFTTLLLKYVSGFLIVALPIIIYLAIKGAILDYAKIIFMDLPFKYSRALGQSGFNLILFKNSALLIKHPLSFSSYYFIKLLAFLVIFMSAFIYLPLFNPLKNRNGLIALLIMLAGMPLLLTNLRQVIGEQGAFYAPFGIILAFTLLQQISFRGMNNIKKAVSFFIAIILLFALTVVMFLESWTQRRFVNSIGSYLSLKKPLDERMKRPFNPYHAASQGEYSVTHPTWRRLDISRAKGIYLPESQAFVISKVVEFIKHNTSSGEEIFVFPHEGQYYFLADRPSPTRFTPVIYAAIDPDYQREVIYDLEKARVRYVIYARDAFVFTDYDRIPNEERLNLIFDYLKNNYLIKKQYGQTLILERSTL